MKIHPNAPVKDITWYKIGGKAKYVLDVEDQDDLLEAVRFVKKEKIDNVFILGYGSNLLFTPEFFDGAIIHVARSKSTPKIEKEKYLTVFAGENLDAVIQYAFDHNLVGLEWAGGLPGTIGAAVRGNVGAFGGQIQDVFKEAVVIDTSGRAPNLIRMTKKDMRFDYRTSNIKRKKNLIVSQIALKLKKGTDEELGKAKQTYFRNIEYRKARHPLDFPNCGSVFKNISKQEEVEKVISAFPDLSEKIKRDWFGKVSVGYLVKRLELEGSRIGDAEISRKHGNFIINLGDAKATDVLDLITVIQERFEEEFEFRPEVEIEIVK